MHSSKIIRPFDEAFQKILEYQPNKVDIGIPEVAKNFTGEQPPPDIEPFRMDELVSIQTGVYKSEKQRIEKRIDDKAVEKLQEVQEKAYQEAYQLGLEEGQNRAYAAFQEKIQNQLQELQNLTQAMKEMKKEVLNKNESVFIDLVYYISEKIVFEHIERRDDIIKNLLKEVVSSLDTKENIEVKLNSEDYQVIQSLLEKTDPNFDFLQKIKFIPIPEIQKGGCIVETDHGLVDATLKERFEKLWTTLNEAKPAEG